MAIISNRKAYFEYFINDEFSAGIILQGSEVKSIRRGHVSFADSFCHIVNGEVFLKNLNIAENKFSGKYTNHEPTRPRKLLLHKSEISKIQKALTQKGLTLVPLKIWITSTGFIKIDIGIAKGKKLFDKRATIKARDNSRDIKKYVS